MPSGEVLKELMEDMRAVIFPGYFGHSDMSRQSLEYYTGAILDRIYHRLAKQIERGLCFSCDDIKSHSCNECVSRSQMISRKLIEKFPEIRSLLASDALAAYDGDPAAKSIGETIFCYPSIRAVTSHRVAHELYMLDVPIIPRIISELAHSETGIDIHPGATIGERFFVDHGTGVVIGETCVIGKNVKIYQGVTLGAISFPLDEHGHPIKGIKRHPNVEDDATIYAGATILGDITIGKGAVIGGNMWITESVHAGAKIHQQHGDTDA